MAGFKLSRDQLASFLKDHQQIKQFERLFDTASNAVTVDPATVDDGDYLYYDGTTLTWVAEAPGALTRVDDTNITLTIGGTPATALLKDVSLTLGWDGVLAVDRGGTGADNAADARINLGITAGAVSTATLNFGAFPGSNEASVTFADTGVIAGSNIQAWFAADSTTADHTAADHRYAPLFISLACLPTAGVGGTIYARSEHKMQGQWAVKYSWS